MSLRKLISDLREGVAVDVPELLNELADLGEDTVAKLMEYGAMREKLAERLNDWARDELRYHRDKKTVWWPVDWELLTVAKTVEEVKEYVLQAKVEGKKLRVCGSQHSAPRAVLDYAVTGEERILELTLDGDLRTITHLGEGRFRVGGGCNLGIDPSDSRSTHENSLCQVMDSHGYALPILGGVSHQTVAGFMTTGSAGGSLTFGFADCVEAFDIMDGTGELHTLRKGSDEFNAAGVSMGLFGVIVGVEVQGQRKFLVRGTEQTVAIKDSVLRDAATYLETARKQEYNHNLLFPNHGVRTTLQFSGKQNLDPDSEIIPYQHPLFNKCRNILAAVTLKLANLFDKKRTQTITDFILRLMNPEEEEPREFNDYWWRCLPNDDLSEIDTLIRVQFTEIWIDLKDTEKVFELLQEMFKNPNNWGTFGIEVYAAKESPFWMSMSYGFDAIRVDPFWYEHNIRGSMEDFFGKYWEVLLSDCPSARLHWGKHWPQKGASFSGRTVGLDYCQKAFPKFEHWLKLRRETFDPDNIFLTEYWREILGIEPFIH